MPLGARRRIRGRKSKAAAACATLLVLPHVLAWGWPLAGFLRGASVSEGTPGRGSLEGARAFAPFSRSRVTCSVVSAALGRQHAHSRVVAAVAEGLDEASRLERRRFVLGEAGWPGGGRLRPHRTHRNGLSVDLFVPLEDERGRDVLPPLWAWSAFGYRLEFDSQGRLGRHRIDWDATVQALSSIDAAARRHGLAVERVILAPELQPLLLADGRASRLGAVASLLNERPSWWRHDEHLHLDFRLVEAGE